MHVCLWTAIHTETTTLKLILKKPKQAVDWVQDRVVQDRDEADQVDVNAVTAWGHRSVMNWAHPNRTRFPPDRSSGAAELNRPVDRAGNVGVSIAYNAVMDNLI